jgi:hypothetical protein
VDNAVPRHGGGRGSSSVVLMAEEERDDAGWRLVRVESRSLGGNEG